ncbi:MAG TPA: SpoIIE family protein phosphatase, partial [Spirochaetota bacterium]|nr:SpoIIE family protein phosphatase [Spirochaetota bacterium]
MPGAHAIIHGEGRIPESEYRFFFVTNVAFLFGFVSHAIFLTVFSFLGVPEMVLHNIASCFVFFIAILANQQRRYRLAMSLAYFEVMIHAAMAVVFIGQDSGFQYYVFVVVPLIFYISVVPAWVRFMMAVVAFLVYAFISYFLRGEPVYSVDPWVLRFIRGGNIAGVVAGFSFIGYWYGRINMIAEAALFAERNKLREKNERMQSELEMARRIQLQLVPAVGPVKGLAFEYRPMTIIGGDFYDFVTFVGRPLEIGIFISDVSGHGVPAALIASMLKSTLLQSVDILDDPPALMTRLNDTLVSKTNDNF